MSCKWHVSISKEISERLGTSAICGEKIAGIKVQVNNHQVETFEKGLVCNCNEFTQQKGSLANRMCVHTKLVAQQLFGVKPPTNYAGEFKRVKDYQFSFVLSKGNIIRNPISLGGKILPNEISKAFQELDDREDEEVLFVDTDAPDIDKSQPHKIVFYAPMLSNQPNYREELMSSKSKASKASKKMKESFLKRLSAKPSEHGEVQAAWLQDFDNLTSFNERFKDYKFSVIQENGVFMQRVEISVNDELMEQELDVVENVYFHQGTYGLDNGPLNGVYALMRYEQ